MSGVRICKIPFTSNCDFLAWFEVSIKIDLTTDEKML